MMPKERSRTTLSTESRNVMGSLVPHFLLMKVLRLQKKHSALKGVSPPKGRRRIFCSIGTLAVDRVWRPGPKVSSACPPR